MVVGRRDMDAGALASQGDKMTTIDWLCRLRLYDRI